MRVLRAWLSRCLGLWTAQRRRSDFNAEIESHLQLHIDDNIHAGMTPAEARRHALMALGGVAVTRETYAERATFPVLIEIAQDFRYAVRQLVRRPAFAGAAAGILALAIAAGASIFTFVDAALIAPLPYYAPDRLVEVTEGNAQFLRGNLSYADYLDWKRQATTLASFDVHTGSGFLVGEPGDLHPTPAARVSPGFFRTLGVTPHLGRDFTAEREPGEPSDEVMLTYAVWRDRFGSRTDVIGEAIRLDGEPRTVVGVLPASFHFAPRGGADIWVPIGTPNACEARRSCHNLSGIARLDDDADIDEARAELRAIAAELERLYPDSNRGQVSSVIPLAEAVIGDVTPALLTLLGGAGVLLLAACINVAGLLIVRTEGRGRELTVRAAIGASRFRLVRQFVVENAVLVGLGGLLGLAAAWWTTPALALLVPTDMARGLPFLADLGVNVRVAAGTLIVCLAALVVFSVIAAVRLGSVAAQGGAAGTTRWSSGVSWQRLGSKLVVAELMLAVVLLVVASLLVRSVDRLLDVDLNFEPDRVATVDVIARGPRVSEPAQSAALFRAIVERVDQVPGVAAAGTTSVLPVSFNGNTDWIRFVGRSWNNERNEVNARIVSSGYLQAIDAALIGGRHFRADDDAAHPRVAIVNEALVRRYFPGENPLGQRFGDEGLSPESIKEIVGVVADVREGPLDDDIWPAVYYPFSQSPGSSAQLVARTAGEPDAMLAAIVAAVRSVDPGIATAGATTMGRRIGTSPSAYLHRSVAWVAGGFALIAWLLGVVGLYSVIAFVVAQRTREIGMRIALGAERRSVSRMVMLQAGRLAAIGLAGGLVLGAGAATLIADLLYGTSPRDLTAFTVAAGILAVSALVAAWIPARRAGSVDPIQALRAE